MKRHKPCWAWLGVAFAMICAPMFDLPTLLNRPASKPMLQDHEDWTIVSPGALTPFAYQLISPGYKHPLGLRFRQDRTLYYTGAWLYFNCRQVITPSRFFGSPGSPPPETYAKIETPSGSYVLTTIDACENNASVYAVQIPAAYAPDTPYLTVTLLAKGLRSTSVRLDILPTTIDRLPQSATPLTTFKKNGIEAQAEAFPVASKKTGEPVGLGYRLHWSGLENQLFWRAATLGISSPFIPAFQGSGPQRGLSFIDMDQGRQSTEAMRAIPYPGDVQMIHVDGQLEGYEIVEDSVDFGTIPLTKEEYTYVSGNEGNRQERTETSYYLKVGESFTRTLKSGLRLTLLPLVSRKERNMYFSWPVICFRLRVEPDSMRTAMKSPAAAGQRTMVDAKLVDYQTGFDRIEPSPYPGSKISNFLAIAAKSANPTDIHLKFAVRVMRLKQQIPYDFRLPIDRSMSGTAPWDYPAMDFVSGALN